MQPIQRALFVTIPVAVALALAPPAQSKNPRDQAPLGATTVIIELTDNDIELQVFVDGSGLWQRLRIQDPNGRALFGFTPKFQLRRQGMSEFFFASNPSHFPEDEEGEIDLEGAVEVVLEFLDRFPAGSYQAEARLAQGGALTGEATLTHVLPALPVILAPLSDGDEPPTVPIDDVVIEWEPVTTRFVGDGPVEIIEYQVIIDQVDPERDQPWVDGSTRRALINLPGTVTQLSVPPEFLVAGAFYEFEILAIEASGNSTISVGEFIPE